MRSSPPPGHLLTAPYKLRQLGEQLVPPHMKPLQGAAAGGLRELRPRQGRSDWRALYARRGDVYVILAFDRRELRCARGRAQTRAAQYADLTGR